MGAVSSCSILVANVMRMSLTCHEEIGRVRRGCSRLSNHFSMSRMSGLSLTCPQQVVRVGLMAFGERHDKWAAQSDIRDILITCYNNVARVGYVREDAKRNLLLWNLGFSSRRQQLRTRGFCGSNVLLPACILLMASSALG